VFVRGSKNAVTKHMVAAVLGEGPSVIRQVPEVGDVAITADILRSLGVASTTTAAGAITVEPHDRHHRGAPVVQRPEPHPDPAARPAPAPQRRGLRALVGGDQIGRRPVDFHIEALTALGAEIEVTDDGIRAKAPASGAPRSSCPTRAWAPPRPCCSAPCWPRAAPSCATPPPSPRSSSSRCSSSAWAPASSCRPGRKFTIDGVTRLRGAETSLDGDRNEAFSYLVAGLVTGGEVRVHGCTQDRLVTAITTLNRMGAEFRITDDYIQASAPDGLRPAAVQTDTHPGFMTDWQTPLVVLFTQADGMSVLHETVYEDRLVYVQALKQMGAEIELFSTCLGGESCRFHDTNALHSAIVKGVKLRGAGRRCPTCGPASPR
jgi:UDP-N-acetylglucosamine 1-carboxyvinyltransferase